MAPRAATAPRRAETFKGNPWRCAIAAVLFGAVEALGLRLQLAGAIDLPYQVFLMMPFVVTIVAMAAQTSPGRVLIKSLGVRS